MMLKELDRLKNSQIIVHEKQENLKHFVEYKASENEKYLERLTNCENQLEIFSKENDKFFKENEGLLKIQSELRDKNHNLDNNLQVPTIII